jgi:murein DD-endopeptidase MepM/ murein hydrolase activator NlpD
MDRGDGILRAIRIWLILGLIVLALLPAHPVLAQELEPVVYVVQEGDTLFSIAQSYGLSVEELAAANGIDDTALISVGQELIIPIYQPGPTPEPQAKPSGAPPVYVVQPGDTLSAIADRFATTVEALVAANDIADPSLIEVGQKLVIPTAHPELVPIAESQPYSRLHPVRSGETLPALAFRYGATVHALREANDLGRLGLILPGQELTIPWPTAAHAGMPRYPEVMARPAPVVQGQTLVVKVQASGALSLTGQLLGQELTFVTGQDGYWALAGVDALTPPGSYLLALAATEGNTGDRLTVQDTLSVTVGNFSTYNVVVPQERQGLLDPTLSASEGELVAAVFAGWTLGGQWEGAFGYPLAGELRVTAQFGQRRSYNGGRVTGYHSGIDYGADKGTPILAPARGTVVLAEQLQVRGRAVILDHGLGVFTGFWHLSQIDVVVGQVLERGEVVGKVGNSGLSTGPHLHWEMRVRGMPVDPVQWTQQVFP